MFESYIQAVAAVYNSETQIAYCIVKHEAYNEHQALCIQNLGGAIPDTTIIMTGSHEECESAIRRRNEKS